MGAHKNELMQLKNRDKEIIVNSILESGIQFVKNDGERERRSEKWERATEEGAKVLKGATKRNKIAIASSKLDIYQTIDNKNHKKIAVMKI